MFGRDGVDVEGVSMICVLKTLGIMLLGIIVGFVVPVGLGEIASRLFSADRCGILREGEIGLAWLMGIFVIIVGFMLTTVFQAIYRVICT